MEKGKALAAEYNIRFLETSAKNNINVEEAFISLARLVLDDVSDSHNQLFSDIKKRLIDSAEEQKPSTNVDLNASSSKKGGCC